jgi:WD40 repeat protein
MRKTTIMLLLLAFTAGLAAQKPRLVVPVGHTSWVESVVFSPDGKMVLTGGADAKAKLWDLSGRELLTFAGHDGQVHSVAFSPDGEQVLTGSWDRTAKLWDLSGEELQAFIGHTDAVSSVAFSPDGKQVLTGSWDNTAKLWDRASGDTLRTFVGHTDLVTSVAFSPDGKQVLTGSNDGTAKLWDLSGKELQAFADHAGWVYSVAFSPDGKQVLTGSKTAKLWDLSGRKPQTFARHADWVRSVAFSPDGKQVLTGSQDGTAKLWDLSGNEVRAFVGHESIITSVAFTPDGKQVLTGSWDNTAKLWDLSGREVRAFRGHAARVHSVAFFPDGTQVLTGSKDNTVKLWDLSGRELRSLAGHGDGEVTSAALSPDGKQILTGSWVGTAKLWDLSGEELYSFADHTHEVHSVAFSPDGKQVLTGGGDYVSRTGTAKLWDSSGREPYAFDGHTDLVNSVAFSPDGKQVLTGSNDNTAKLWDLSGKELWTFSGHAGSVTSVAFSPDGKQVLTGSGRGDETAKLWDLSGSELQTFDGHTPFVTSVIFSPNGKQVLTGGADAKAKLWDLSGSELRAFVGHAETVRSVAFSPNGKQVLTGSDDNTTKLWDTQSGQELATLIALDSIDWAVTTPSGMFDASPGAMNLMHFVVGIEAIELEQLKERYYEPGLLGKLTGFNQDSLRSVEGFDNLPLFPEMEAQLSEDGRKLQVNLRARSGGIGKLSFFVNGKEVLEEANPGGAASATIDLTKFAAYYLPGKTNKLVLRAYDAKGWLKSAPLELDYDPPTAARGSSSGSISNPFAAKQPSLYAIVVGTADYAGDLLDLTFADLDAAYFSQALRAAAPKVFGEQRVEVVLLNTDAKSTERQGISNKASIRKAFTDIAAKAQAQDVLVIYFSGHGLNYGTAENSQFYYLTKDIANENLRDEGLRKNYAISSSELTEWINAIPALKQVMIIDACNAGKIVEDLSIASRSLSSAQIRALDRMKDRTGMFILTGSAADKVSYEARQYGQGLLTFSLLEGISGLALAEDNRVDVMKLFQYARDRVPELSPDIKGIQTPMLAFPVGGASFDIGIVDASVRKKIPVAQIKPVFVRNVFLDIDESDDVLELGQALNDYFRGFTVKGSQAELIFVDVPDYENAYSIRGTYTMKGDEVQVRGRLRKGKERVGDEFTVMGKKDDVRGLVNAIMAQVDGVLKPKQSK